MDRVSFSVHISNRANRVSFPDREEALRDDFHFESSYDYGEDDEWEDDATWNGDEDAADETVDTKEESKAYLEFLNDEVCI